MARSAFPIAAALVLVATVGAACTGSASPTQSAVPSNTPAPSPDASHSPERSIQPVPSLIVPGPQATIPEGTQVIPGLRLESLVATLENSGMTCGSEVGMPDGGAGYALGCEGTLAAANADFGLRAVYWTSNAVSEVILTATSHQFGGSVEPGVPSDLFSAVSSLSGGAPAQVWVQRHLDDPACSPHCTGSFGALRITLYVGESGAREVDIWEAGG